MNLKNKHICITGTLKRMSRNEAKTAITESGAIFSNHVNSLTDILVIARDSFISEKYQKAIEMAEAGTGIILMKEAEFYRALKA